MISVEKIGGTSMSAFEDVLKNIILHEPNRIYGRVYIVSAYSGVTNWLLEHKKTGEPGVYAKFAEGGEYGRGARRAHRQAEGDQQGAGAHRARLAVADGFIERRMTELKAYLDSMRHVLSSGYLRKRGACCSPRARCWPPSARRTAPSTASRSSRRRGSRRS